MWMHVNALNRFRGIKVPGREIQAKAKEKGRVFLDGASRQVRAGAGVKGLRRIQVSGPLGRQEAFNRGN